MSDGDNKDIVRPPYMDNLSVVERAGAIKLGCYMAMGHNNVTPSMLQKSSALGNIELVPKSILVASLLGGIPLGVLGHAMGRATDTAGREEREGLDRLRYYRKLTAGMERNLPAPTPEEEEAQQQA